jgi:hypothetical protein
MVYCQGRCQLCRIVPAQAVSLRQLYRLGEDRAINIGDRKLVPKVLEEKR